MTLGERLKGYRTIIWNGIVMVAAVALPVVDALGGLNWSAVTPTHAAVVLFALSLIGIFLRVITTTPIGEK